jgi:23S rRNA pseudouridine1911/1915/1917 synthase
MTDSKNNSALHSGSGTINVLFEDTHCLVISKPSGLLSQGDASGEENLVDLLRSYFGRNYVGLVHRLDRNVSGLMVIGKRSKSADRLSEALRTGTLIRKYQAWVSGIPKETFQLKNFLLKDEKKNEVKVVSHGGIPGAKEAILNGRRLRVLEGAGPLFNEKNIPQVSEIELTLETGRSHQIRVQLAASGHPILNDLKYGGEPLQEAKNKLESGSSKSLSNRQRIYLHSAFLSFPHPMSKEEMKFEEKGPWAL